MKYKINLFPLKKQNLAERITYFSFHYLRYILVITQIVVIGVFFYRFKIDQELVDLKDSLSQKQEIVAISAPLIKEIQAVEMKTFNVDKVLQSQQQLQNDLDYILSVFPEKLTLDKLVLSDGSYSLSGVTSDASIIKMFYDKLKKDKKFSVIELKDLKKGSYGFSFTFSLANGQVKKNVKK